MPRTLARAAVAATFLVPMLVLGWLAWPFQVDDAFITFRYGHHLAEGLGLRWNPGGAPLEGYTNFLYVVLSAGLQSVHAPPMLVMKGLGAAAWLGLLPATAAFVTRTGGDRREAFLASLPIALSPGVALWAVAGLETTLFTLLIGLALVAFTRDTPRGDAWAAVALLFAALARTEGPAFALALALLRAGQSLRRGGWELAVRRMLPWVAGFAAPWLVYFAARAWYFGAWFPNPVLFKSGFAEGAGRSVLIPFALTWWPLLLLAAVGAALAWRRRLPALAVVLAGAAVYATVSDGVHGTTTMAFFDRFLVPLVPSLATLAAVPLAPWLSAEAPRARRLAGTAAVAALCGWIVFNPIANPGRIGTLALSQREGVGPSVEALIRFLSAKRPPGYRVAIGDVGMFAWRYDGQVDDLFGLNDAEYTRVCHNQLDCWTRTLLQRDPDGFVFVMNGDEAAHEVERRLLASAAFRARFARAQVFQSGINPWAYVLYERAPSATASP